LGFLEKLFRRKALPQPAPAKTALAASEAKKKLEEKLEEKRSALAADYEKAAEKISAQATQVKAAVEALSKKSLSESTPGHKIGLQARDDYCGRIPKMLDELARREASWSDYAKKLARANAEIMRATRDNRYLFHFFPEEMKRVGNAMKQLAESVKEFEETASREENETQEILLAKEKISFLEKAVEELSLFQAREKQLEAQATALEGQVRKAEGSDYEEREAALKQEIEAAEKSLEETRQQISEIVSPLQRLLRKYQKLATDKELASLAVKYSENPVGQALKEFSGGECPALKRLAGEVKQAITTGMLAVEARDEQKTLRALSEILEGKVDALASKARNYTQETEGASARLEFLLNEKASFDLLKNKALQAAAELEKARNAVSSAKEKIARARKEASEATCKALDAEVVVE
jgi:chromosome segregation ATPase